MGKQMEYEIIELTRILNRLMPDGVMLEVTKKCSHCNLHLCNNAEEGLKRYNEIVKTINKGYYNTEQCLNDIKVIIDSPY